MADLPTPEAHGWTAEASTDPEHPVDGTAWRFTYAGTDVVLFADAEVIDDAAEALGAVMAAAARLGEARTLAAAWRTATDVGDHGAAWFIADELVALLREDTL